jgi:hypothetical protein
LDYPGYLDSTALDGFVGTGYGVMNFMLCCTSEDVGVVLLMNMFDFRYYGQNKDVFIYIFEEAMKIGDPIPTIPELEWIGFLFTPLIISFACMITIYIRRRIYPN